MNSHHLTGTATPAPSGSLSGLSRRALLTTAALGATAPALAPIAIAGEDLDRDTETPVARLYSIIRALAARIDAIGNTGDDDPDFLALSDRLYETELRMARTPARTPHDMALKIWIVRHDVHNNGDVSAAILSDAARMIGPIALHQLDRMKRGQRREY